MINQSVQSFVLAFVKGADIRINNLKKKKKMYDEQARTNKPEDDLILE